MSNNSNITQPNWNMITAPYLGICVILMTVILLSLLYKLYGFEHVRVSHPVASKFYKVVTVISISSFIISSGIDFGDLVYYFATGIDVIHTEYVWLIALTNMFYGISAVTLYMIVFGKLYFTLKNTEETYQLNECTVYYMVVMISLIGFLLQFYAASLLLLYTHRVFFYEMLAVIFWIIAVSDLILTISMVVMFINQLFRIIMDYSNRNNDNVGIDTKSSYYQAGYDKDDHHHDPLSAAIDDDESGDSGIDADSVSMMPINFNLNESQTILLEVITRHSILCTFAIVSNQLFYASVLYAGSMKDRDEQDLYFLAYSKIVKSTQGVINACALYLNFGFNVVLYRRWCGCCHASCYNRFKGVLQKKIDDCPTYL